MGFESAKKNWEGLAQRDALWSICTTQGMEGGKWNEAEFFATGEKEIGIIFDFLKQHNLEPANRQEALDFGCGVGRLSRALSSRFEQVTGVDVSATMVQKAKDLNATFKGKTDFVHNPNPDLSIFQDNRFSFIYTTIVLQHIPYPASMNYLAEFLRILQPGGLLVFQIPTEDVRKLPFLTWLKTQLKIRERLALLGIGKGYHMSMYPVEEKVIHKVIQSHRGEVLKEAYTNHTDPNFDGEVQFLERDSCIDFLSRLFVVRKNS